MNNSQRYRLNAADCLLAAKKCQSDYRGLLVSTAALWHALARQDDAIEELLASWAAAAPETGRVLAFQPTSPGAGSLRRRASLCAGRDQRRQGSAELVVLGERRAGIHSASIQP
jgi:hypothetical protein